MPGVRAAVGSGDDLEDHEEMTGPITIRGYAPGLEHREGRPDYLVNSGATIKVVLSSHIVEFAVTIEELRTFYRRAGQFIGIKENGFPQSIMEMAMILSQKLGCLRNDALAALFEAEWDEVKATEMLTKSGLTKQSVAAEPPSAQAIEAPAPAIEPAKAEEKVESPKCPKCGSPTKSRKKKSDGSKFWGCVRYPDCKGTVDA